MGSCYRSRSGATRRRQRRTSRSSPSGSAARRSRHSKQRGQEAVDAYFREAMSAGTTMAEVLSGCGYECTDQEVRVMQRQD
jgi:hypothetical protein